VPAPQHAHLKAAQVKDADDLLLLRRLRALDRAIKDLDAQRLAVLQWELACGWRDVQGVLKGGCSGDCSRVLGDGDAQQHGGCALRLRSLRRSRGTPQPQKQRVRGGCRGCTPDQHRGQERVGPAPMTCNHSGTGNMIAY